MVTQNPEGFVEIQIDLRSEREKIADILGSKIDIVDYGNLGYWEYDKALDDIMIEMERIYREGFEEGFEAGEQRTLEEIEAQITAKEFEEDERSSHNQTNA